MKCDFWKDEPLAAALPSADRICARTFVFDGPDELERTHIPVHFENEIIWDRTPNGDPEWVYALNRLTFLPVLGRAYAATGKECYARQAADLLKEWEQNAPLCEQSKTTTWRPLEAGIRCETLLRTAWLFRECPLFDVSAVERILRVHAAWLMESDGSFQALSNWGMIQNHGLLLAGLALGEELWRDTAVQRMTRCLQMQVLSDGSHCEICFILIFVVCFNRNDGIPILIECLSIDEHCFKLRISRENCISSCQVMRSVLGVILFNFGEIFNPRLSFFRERINVFWKGSTI